MADLAAETLDRFKARRRSAARRKPTPIVPSRNVVGAALAVTIGIMTFLSCLTMGAVSMVRDAAGQWESQIAREATIQIKPAEGVDMEEALARAAEIASAQPGVTSVRIIDRAATTRLLQPWLGENFDIDRLPVPRLVVVAVDRDNLPDFAQLRGAIAEAVPNATLDDHRTWVDRLVGMARTTVAIGFSVMALMLSATILSVVFATRGAMSGNHGVIEVLHFVGAEGAYIARAFRQHFLVTGLKGALAGGALAVLAFAGFSWWSQHNLATPQGDQAMALFGAYAIGPSGYVGVGLIVIVVALLCAATSHVTVLSHLSHLDGEGDA